MAVADRCTVLRKGKYMGTVDIKDTTKEELSRMMVGRDVPLQVNKACQPRRSGAGCGKRYHAQRPTQEGCSPECLFSGARW